MSCIPAEFRGKERGSAVLAVVVVVVIFVLGLVLLSGIFLFRSASYSASLAVAPPIASAVHRHPFMLPVFSPGSARRLAAFLSRGDRSPRLAFAGDYLVAPSAEGAVTSGMRAATEIAHSLDDH